MSKQLKHVFVALGDSLTEGYDEHTQQLVRTPWPKVIDQTAIILAKCGKRTDQLYCDQFTQAKHLNPTQVSIMIGANDILQNKFSAKHYEDMMHEMIEYFQQQGAQVLTASIPPLTSQTPFAFGKGQNIEADLNVANTILSKLATHYQTCHFEDWSDLNNQSCYFDEGAIHPNQSGYMTVAKHYQAML